MRKITKYYHTILSIALCLLTHPALANRLEEAAQRGQSLLISIGQITSVIGIVLGGIILSLGMASVGRMILMSGLMGACATFGGPALIEALRGIFS